MNFSKFTNCILFRVMLIFILTVVLTTDSFSQAPPVIWNKTWGGPTGKDDIGASCVSDGTGFLYITGSTKNSGSGNNHDVVTIKYNQSTGDTVWSKIYNNPNNKDEEGAGCSLANDGNLYVVGYTDLGSSVTNDYLLVMKYNVSNGSVMWTKTYGVPNANQHGRFCASDGANLYVAGLFENGSQRYMMIWKLNSNGDTLWTKQYTGSAGSGFSCAVDASGNLYVSGYALDGANQKVTLWKYNSSGTMQWMKYSSDILDPNGSNPYTGCAVSGNNIFVTGYAGNSANRYGITMKYTNTGDTLWVKRNDSPSIYDQNHGCKADISGDVYVCATRYNGTNDDWVILKYKGLDGTQLWSVVYNHTTNNSDYAVNCALDNSGNLYAIGMVNFNNSNSDIYTVKYQSTVGIRTISEMVPERYSLSQNYPNPFNPTTVIRFSLPVVSFSSIKIFDITGKEVSTLVNEQLAPGTYSVDWNAGDYPSGVYFYKLITGKYTDTKRMVLVR